MDLSPQEYSQLQEQGSLQFQQDGYHHWLAVVSEQPLRYLWGIRSKPWTPNHLSMATLLQQRLGHLLRLWFPCANPMLKWRLPASMQTLQQQLRSPITNLRMGFLMLNQAQLSERQRHYLQIIQNEQQHYQDLVNQWQTNLASLGQDLQLGSPDFAQLAPGIRPDLLADLQDFQTDPELLGILAKLALTDHVYRVKTCFQCQQRWYGWQIEFIPDPNPETLRDIRCLATTLQGEVIWDPPSLRIWIPDLGGEPLYRGRLVGEHR